MSDTNLKRIEDGLTRRGFIVEVEYTEQFMQYEFRIHKGKRPCWEMDFRISEENLADMVYPDDLVEYLEHEFNRQTSGDTNGT